MPIDLRNHLPKSSLSPCKQPGPVSTLICIAVGHHQQAPLWWKVATARSLLYSTGHCDRSHSLEPGWCAVHSTPSKLLSARSVPCGRAYRPVGIDCKGTSSCHFPPERCLLMMTHRYTNEGRNRSQAVCRERVSS